MIYPAYLHSLEDSAHSHTQERTKVNVLSWNNDNDIVVQKTDGTVCHAVFNAFCGKMFVDDVYGVIRKENGYEF